MLTLQPANQITMKAKTGFLVTADCVPSDKVADHYLNALRSIIGGRRGYGGKPYSGHWLLTKATREEYDSAVEFLKIKTPVTDSAWNKYKSTEWTAEQAIEVSRMLERKLTATKKQIAECEDSARYAGQMATAALYVANYCR